MSAGSVTKVHCSGLFSHLRSLALVVTATKSQAWNFVITWLFQRTVYYYVCGLYPHAMTKETASLVSVNTVDAETQQPQNVINSHGLCDKKDNC